MPIMLGLGLGNVEASDEDCPLHSPNKGMALLHLLLIKELQVVELGIITFLKRQLLGDAYSASALSELCLSFHLRWQEMGPAPFSLSMYLLWGPGP